MLGRVLTVGAFFVFLAQLTACGGDNAGACNASNECPSGEVCQSHTCVKTCDSATLCPGGYTCQNNICVSGSTGVPQINTVAGTSELNCGENGACIGTAFLVTGAHFTNTTFNMADSEGRTYDMTVQDGGNDNAVTLVPVLARRQTDLFADRYVLTAVNQSGSATSELQLLQGEPGPDLTADELIDRINTASANKKILASRLEGGTSGGGGDAAGIVVKVNGSGSGGPAVSLDVDTEALKTLCGDDDGCDITLGATKFHGSGTAALEAYEIEAALNGGTCRFFLNPSTLSWTVSQDCVAIYGLYKYQSTAGDGTPVYVYDRAYQRYEYSSTFGKKNSGSASTYTGCGGGSGGTANGDGDGGPLIVLGFKGACYFAEGPADNSKPGTGCLLDDGKNSTDHVAANFSLIASSPTWDYPGAYPRALPPGNVRPWRDSDTTRECVLTVKD